MSPITPSTVERPWGTFVEFTRNVPSTVKILVIKKGEALSLQKHHLRAEFWYVISGKGIATIGEEQQELSQGITCFVKQEENHRLEATVEDLHILEIALGEAQEDDIVRMEDKYGRVSTTP